MTRRLSKLSPAMVGILSVFFFSLGAQARPLRDIPQSRTYQDVKAFLRQVVAAYPQNARIVEIGTNDAGLAIEALAVGDGPVKNLVVGTHHGNEYGSTEVAKGFAASVAEAPILGQTVYVIPVLNTTGYDRRSRWEQANGRTNDPNRDYPGPCGTAGPFKLKSTAALAAFMDRENIVASNTLHTYTPAVLYPWGMSTRDRVTEYEDVFRDLGRMATVESGYQSGNSADIVYPADGTFEDYAFWQHGVWSLLWEMGYSHSPSPDQVKEMVRVNVPGLRRMFENAPRERAERHAFTGRCDKRLRALDRHIE